MEQTVEGKIMDQLIPVLLADSTVLAALVALRAKAAAKPEDALEDFRASIHKSMDRIYTGTNLPPGFADKIRARIDEIFTAAPKFMD
ncbi:hypothetical protein [Caballeronia sordidicola]|uniref:Uncharacterized protein n=1 Tax=Caballeronia sordidicola TaxID=196367 RepID=A0A242N7T5_CABSO|nr:hypothetical protein [Caballeronia sordidicola]OTP79474.1 hypothetical protein PAMC26577_01005 [Caballeronia sordidicola]